jgi:hypothetical protein
MRVENQINTSLGPEIPTKNAIEEFHLWSFLCQDYDDFDVANEDDLLEEFLGLPRKNPKVGIPVVFSLFLITENIFSYIFLLGLLHSHYDFKP